MLKLKQIVPTHLVCAFEVFSINNWGSFFGTKPRITFSYSSYAREKVIKSAAATAAKEVTLDAGLTAKLPVTDVKVHPVDV